MRVFSSTKPFLFSIQDNIKQQQKALTVDFQLSTDKFSPSKYFMCESHSPS